MLLTAAIVAVAGILAWWRFAAPSLALVLAVLVATGVGVALAITGLRLSRLKGRLHTTMNQEKGAREEAERGEKRLAEHLDRVSDAFFVLDSEYRYTYLNHKAEQLAQRSKEELLGKVVWDEYPELVGTRFEREYRRAQAEGESVHFEAHLPPRQSWYEAHAYPSDEGLSIFVRSIEDRKRAEEALLNQARQQAAVAEVGLRSISATSTSVLMDEIVNVVTRALGVEFAKVLELSPEGDALRVVSGAGFEPEVVGSATVEAGRRSLAGYTLLLGGPVVATDLREETRFGASPLLLDRGIVSAITVIIGSREQPFGVLGAFSRTPRDFTHDDANFLQAVASVLSASIERRRSDEALRESELRFRQLAENLQEVLFLRDAALTKMYYINPAYERVWGQSREGMYEDAKAWMDAIHPEDAPRIAELVGEKAQELEFRIVRPDGTIRWIHSRSFPVTNAGTGGDRLVGIAEDVTERKEAEENERRLRRAETARAKAEAAARAREEVMAIVSHDLRSPLNTIGLCTQGLPRAKDIEPFVARIDRAVGRMTALIGDLLDFGNIEAGRLRLERRETRISELFDEILESFGPLAQSQNLTLEAWVAEPAPIPVVDHDRMIQVLSNLVGNALKFTDQGRVVLRASRSQGETCIEVRDTGCGIPSEALPHIFERFWRVADHKERETSGLGLGLAIVKGIVEAHGGHVGVDSEPGEGTTFTIVIPDSRPASELDRPAGQPAA